MKENEHTVTVQMLIFTLFLFFFVKIFYCFSATYCSNLAMSLCVKHMLLQRTTNVSSHSVVHFDISISLNIVQFVVRMRSNKNHQTRHSRKKFCQLKGFSIKPWIFKFFTHNGYCFYFSALLI